METKTKVKYNPKVGMGFSNDKFGKGSIKVDLDAAGIKTFIENAQVGGALILKFNKITSAGNNHYFCEILGPYIAKSAHVVTKGSSKSTTEELG